MITDNWYCCPSCGKKLFKIKSGAVIVNVEYKCPRCKKLIEIEVKNPSK